MLLDCSGRKIRRAIGFVGGYVLEANGARGIDALVVVGSDSPAKPADDDDGEAALSISERGA
jgi:hypothetical protein